jgi:outer membrane biosynthesis protein TonB
VRVGDAVRASVGFAAILAASLAHADYKDSYARGVKAYRDGNLGEARTLIAQALSDHPEPATKVRLYGQVYEPYVPQFYLGEIAFKQGDCAAALTQFNAAASKAVVAELPDLSGTQQRDAATCAQKTAVAKKEEKLPEPPPAKPVEPPVAKPIVKNTPPPPVIKPPSEKPVAVEKTVATKNEAPQPLVEAFDEYLAGHYSNVSRINPEVYADAKARYHAFLVRAASKFTLGKIDGDEQLLAAARSDAKAARALDAATPDASLFSPAFRAFYQESR